MGADFEMAMAVFLKDDTPQDILAAFRCMVARDNDGTTGEPPTNPFSEADFPSAYRAGSLSGWFQWYHPATDYPPTYSHSELRVHTNDPEEFMLEGGYTHFPGEYGAALRKVYRYNRSVNEGAEPVYTWMLSFRVASDVHEFGDYWEFASTVARYSESEGFVGYYRFDYADTPTLFYCKNGKLLSYDVPWVPENLKT
jgi:hypothetical protein